MRHRAFTLTELLVAAATTALVAGAAAALTSAVVNASTQTRDLRSVRTAGHFALGRIGRTIREARAVGTVTSTSVNLWLEDANGEDRVDLYECGILRYDADKKQILFEYMESSSDPPPATKVTGADFKDAAKLDQLMNSNDRKTVVWADAVTSCLFTGYPNNTETRIVEVVFTIAKDGGSTDFRVAASPRASADYLFDASAYDEPSPLDRRIRTKISKWTGLN